MSVRDRARRSWTRPAWLAGVGVVTTVALAWGGAVLMGTTPLFPAVLPRKYVEGERVYVYRLTWTWLAADCWLREQERGSWMNTAFRDGADATPRDLPYWCAERGAENTLVVQACGFPFRAMKHVQRDGMHESMFNPAKDWGVGPDAFLPTRIVWPGFLADVVVWSGVLGVVLAAPGVVTRRRREAAGRCVACGYDLCGGRGVCPECGYSG